MGDVLIRVKGVYDYAHDTLKLNDFDEFFKELYDIVNWTCERVP